MIGNLAELACLHRGAEKRRQSGFYPRSARRRASRCAADTPGCHPCCWCRSACSARPTERPARWPVRRTGPGCCWMLCWYGVGGSCYCLHCFHSHCWSLLLLCCCWNYCWRQGCRDRCWQSAACSESAALIWQLTSCCDGCGGHCCGNAGWCYCGSCSQSSHCCCMCRLRLQGSCPGCPEPCRARSIFQYRRARRWRLQIRSKNGQNHGMAGSDRYQSRVNHCIPTGRSRCWFRGSCHRSHYCWDHRWEDRAMKGDPGRSFRSAGWTRCHWNYCCWACWSECCL